MIENQTNLKHFTIINLPDVDDVVLLGMTSTGIVIAEGYSEARENATICRIEPDGNLVLLPKDTSLPQALISPEVVPAGHPLHFSGARLRGLRETDRIQALVQPLSILEKMALISHLALSVSPMQVLGIAESRVLSQAMLTPTLAVICRRVRIAYALPSIAKDADGLPYDYDTLPLYLLHAYHPQTTEVPPLEDCLGEFAGVRLHRPLDCLYHAGRLVVTEGSTADQPCRIVIWKSG